MPRGSASRSSTRPGQGDGRGIVAQVSEPERERQRSALDTEVDLQHRRAVGEGDRAGPEQVLDMLHPGDRPRGEPAGQTLGVEGPAHGQLGVRDRGLAPGRRGLPGRAGELADHRRRAAEDPVDGLVQLALAAETGRGGDGRHRPGGRQQQLMGAAGPSHARQGHRPRAGAGHQRAVQGALGDMQLLGEVGHARRALRPSVQCPCADQCERPRGQCAVRFPAVVPRGHQRAAALACPEAALYCCRGAGDELHAVTTRRARGTGGTTEDPGGAHTGEEHAVEAGIASGDRGIPLIVRERLHPPSEPRRGQ